ncbi:hypothetical protein L249_3593 [Ophiocordyceps polyrhachis-furcata BCC 54312]|uniref:Uncharacterized protein n=1 Tax=Ophiocordyceps polyrhachis-furcata BCC 54312 TaxID=1330021 RepID=A0A367LM27_9HYPO|nr:hypothetical protein L249_3593 [Ophiocordyceps polyrhachis-furcata BCC 54312]
MGSQEKELTVLPFGDHQAVNPSWEIAKRLPAELPPTQGGGPRVRIIVYPEPIRVSYRTVRNLVPTLWDDDDKKKEEEEEEGDDGGKNRRRRHIDAAIHIGMAGPRAIYQLERRAHRSGYPTPDVDGALPEDDDDNDNDVEQQEEDDDDDDDDDDKRRPAELTTDLRLEDILARWRNLTDPDMDLRLSDDAGRFLCEFIYYASLSELAARNRRRHVVFFHVPCHATERYIAQGHELALSLVRALADSLVAAGRGPETVVTTWWGCGKHIVAVMKDIPVDQRCSCNPKVERDGTLYPPMGSKPAS